MPAAFASIKPNHNLMCYVNIKGQICVSFTTQYTNVSPLIKFPAQTPLATSAWVTMTSDFGGIIWFIGQDQKIYELVAKDFNAPEKATLTCMTKEVVNNDKDVLAAKGATILGLIITSLFLDFA